MTDQQNVEREALREKRHRLSDHEAMADAQAGCTPCQLCGGKAIITDAGTGCGYYIRCENSRRLRESEGCLITDRRLGGWAYNVMDWWNRLHATPPASEQAEPSDDVKVMREALEKVSEQKCERNKSDDYNRGWEAARYATRKIARQALAACKDANHE